MLITTFFSESGVPATGISATIRIRRVSDNSLLVTDNAMTEIGDGFYKYNYVGYDPDISYVIRCDGGSSLPYAERYKYAANNNTESIIDDVQDSLTVEINQNETKLNTVISNQATIEGKVDLLGTQSSLDDIETKIDNTYIKLTNVESDVAVVQADLDNPDQFKADISALALESSVQTAITDIQTNEDKIDDLPVDIDTQLTTTHGSGSWVDAGGLTASDIADAVWDEDQGDHTSAGSMGEYLTEIKDTAQSASDKIVIAWDFVHPDVADLEAIGSNGPANIAMSFVDATGQVVLNDTHITNYGTFYVNRFRGGSNTNIIPTGTAMGGLPGACITYASINYNDGNWQGGDVSQIFIQDVQITYGTQVFNIPLAVYSIKVIDGQQGLIEDINTFVEDTNTRATLIQSKLTDIESDITVVQADLDNPSQYKADLTGIALETSVQSAISEINDNEAKLDIIDANVDTININTSGMSSDISAIKAKTDQLQFTTNKVHSIVQDKGVLNDPSASDIDTELTTQHGSGSWISDEGPTLISNIMMPDIIDAESVKSFMRINYDVYDAKATTSMNETNVTNVGTYTVMRIRDNNLSAIAGGAANAGTDQCHVWVLVDLDDGNWSPGDYLIIIFEGFEITIGTTVYQVPRAVKGAQIIGEIDVKLEAIQSNTDTIPLLATEANATSNKNEILTSISGITASNAPQVHADMMVPSIYDINAGIGIPIIIPLFFRDMSGNNFLTDTNITANGTYIVQRIRNGTYVTIDNDTLSIPTPGECSVAYSWNIGDGNWQSGDVAIFLFKDIELTIGSKVITIDTIVGTSYIMNGEISEIPNILADTNNIDTLVFGMDSQLDSMDIQLDNIEGKIDTIDTVVDTHTVTLADIIDDLAEIKVNVAAISSEGRHNYEIINPEYENGRMTYAIVVYYTDNTKLVEAYRQEVHASYDIYGNMESYEILML